MKTPGRIVVGVDGSPNSLDALVWAVGQAALTGAGVQAVIAWDYPTLAGVDPMTTRVDWRAKAPQTIDARLARAMGRDRAKVSSVVIAGHPAEVLVDASVGAELLVVGKRRDGGCIDPQPGSVREDVITHATCPVLVMCHASDASTGESE
jgi:nucleotide-binding universal stress UspA family protein